ncbi:MULTISPECIES: DUF979 domain-containing protein [Paraburkholderia]|uniref:DUF979 domain-containing protein n=1 Tax=Paraburkholderia TaxID=1822464 RepID=UPI000375332C|nr:MULTISPECIES: DUF979 domain-containing protein [Paraburkholderia]MDH6146230.1 putative membrane protein [Paraburkholderia sp. WSM4179]
MISLTWFFWLLGVLLFVIGGVIVSDRDHPKRWLAGGFWMLYGVVFLAGDVLPTAVTGVIVIVMALVAGFGGVTGAKPRVRGEAELRERAKQLGNRLFMPALTIPAVTVVGTLLSAHLVFGSHALLDPKNVTLVSFGIGCIVALALACRLTRDTVGQSIRETRRLIDALSWAVVLPQLLGMLGLVFADAGVGKAVAHLSTTYIDLDHRFVAVAVYCIGMALFTVIMGNGFAAFPVMTGGIGVPVLVGVFHGNPATMAAIGMFSGYCGTLLTPMAANYNIVPAALLELPDKYGVIRAQVPTALILLAVNVVLLNTLMFA